MHHSLHPTLSCWCMLFVQSHQPRLWRYVMSMLPVTETKKVGQQLSDSPVLTGSQGPQGATQCRRR